MPRLLICKKKSTSPLTFSHPGLSHGCFPHPGQLPPQFPLPMEIGEGGGRREIPSAQFVQSEPQGATVDSCHRVANFSRPFPPPPPLTPPLLSPNSGPLYGLSRGAASDAPRGGISDAQQDTGHLGRCALRQIKGAGKRRVRGCVCMGVCEVEKAYTIVAQIGCRII